MTQLAHARGRIWRVDHVELLVRDLGCLSMCPCSFDFSVSLVTTASQNLRGQRRYATKDNTVKQRVTTQAIATLDVPQGRTQRGEQEWPCRLHQRHWSSR